MSVPSARLTANQSQPPPPTEMKSPHWWSNQAWPSPCSVAPVEGQRARRRHRGPRVVVRTAGRRRSRSSRRVSCRAGAFVAWSARSRPSPSGMPAVAASSGASAAARWSVPPRRPSSRPVVRPSRAATGRGRRATGRSRPARRRRRAASGPPAARPRAAGRSVNRSPVSSVTARCEAHDVGKAPRSARKIDVLEAVPAPSSDRRWPV